MKLKKTLKKISILKKKPKKSGAKKLLRSSSATKKSQNNLSTSQMKAEVTRLKRLLFVAERMRFESIKNAHSRADVPGALLAAGIAHEFNNILGAVDGHAEWALEDPKPDQMREALEIVRIGCQRASRITRALRGMTQPREEERELISILDLKKELESFVQPWIKKGDIKFSTNFENFMVYGHRGQLLEILLNLIKNSIESRVSDRALEIDVQSKIKREGSRKELEIDVSDNGCGVNEVYAEEIFKPFFTTKGVLSAVHEKKQLQDVQAVDASMGGTGLGLFLSRTMAQEHGGDLILKKSVSGAGSCFSLTLPWLSENNLVKNS